MRAKEECEVPEHHFRERCRKVAEFAADRGLSAVVAYSATWIHQWTQTGHGQGLDYSEQLFLSAGIKQTLKPGHVFVLHVCLGVPGTNILLNPIAELCHVT